MLDISSVHLAISNSDLDCIVYYSLDWNNTGREKGGIRNFAAAFYCANNRCTYILFNISTKKTL